MRTKDEASVAEVEQSSEKAVVEEVTQVGRGTRIFMAIIQIKREFQWEDTNGWSEES